MLIWIKEKELFLDLVVSLKHEIWRFALLIPKFIDYRIKTNKTVSIMEEFYQCAIVCHDVVGWNNLNLVVFEGWLIMIRYLINNNPNSVELTFQSLHRFFEYFKRFLMFLKDTISSFNKNCFFKLITCIQVTLKKIYIIYAKNSNFKLIINFSEKCLSIMNTISKMDEENFTLEDILKLLDDIFTTPSSLVLK